MRITKKGRIKFDTVWGFNLFVTSYLLFAFGMLAFFFIKAIYG